MRRTFSIFTMDVIAKCAFGLNIDNLGSEDDPFLTNAQAAFNADALKSPSIVMPCEYVNWKYSSRSMAHLLIYRLERNQHF